MVNPQIWGDKAWTFFFSVVAYYPDNPGIDMQHHYKRFFFHLRWVLPCDFCSENYEYHFRKWPIDEYLKSRPALFRWLANMYNETRRDQGKEPLSDHQIIYKFFSGCGKGVPEEMIALLCTARNPEWWGLLNQEETNGDNGGNGGSFQTGKPIGSGNPLGSGKPLGSTQEGGANFLMNLDQRLEQWGIKNPTLVLVILILLGTYWYLFTRPRRL